MYLLFKNGKEKIIYQHSMHCGIACKLSRDSIGFRNEVIARSARTVKILNKNKYRISQHSRTGHPLLLVALCQYSTTGHPLLLVALCKAQTDYVFGCVFLLFMYGL
jgi:hypothetical protein